MAKAKQQFEIHQSQVHQIAAAAEGTGNSLL